MNRFTQQRILDGDLDAYGEVVREHQDMLLGYSASQKWLWTFQRRYTAWLSDSYSGTNKTPINVNERTLRKLVHVALYSPAVCVLRSKYISTEGLTWSADKSGKAGILCLAPYLEEAYDPVWEFDGVCGDWDEIKAELSSRE
jgi:hypothetical protein